MVPVSIEHAHKKCEHMVEKKKKMATTSPFSDPKSKSGASIQLLKRLEQCWNQTLNWDLFPTDLKEVHVASIFEGFVKFNS